MLNSHIQMPTQNYKITFQPMNRTVEVDPADLPYGNHGLAGSILDIALKHGIQIEHACGGVCACSTCHVIIKQGFNACHRPTEDEEDKLDDAYGLKPQSRLACQCVPDGTKDIVVEIPEWNRNLAKEGED
ncbi:MAG: 2Fe-2S iron-sulfur cluster binding domain-containing protein [Planctomycetota bacterium]|nr:MAG: 2Fe-2S iron-sulfur cluster binding domain-containing protein [Planctomycetota bacterium]